MNQKNLTPHQKAFLKKAARIVDARITDPGFTVEEFSRLMELSRSQLFRKLKTATGASVSVFIRGRRLKYALSLLEKGELPIARVASKVGFSGDTYFRKCFKEAYSMTPTEYISQI
ncbi:helix-turn-helix transcriptional regulator [candidate division KSB1 bacterium]|nr:helix-turn-helix transcriptional regulator [candidate division KSB1 bacterium]MBL7095966.1 helix-turn-helix transcriptional regulator [candidate division KSB1 bacterium]